MTPEEMMQGWPEQSEEVAQTLREWRTSHPKATMAEIERAVEEQISRLRISLIEALATDELKERTEKPAAIACPQCGERMQRRGKHQRRLQSQGGKRVTLTREYHSCPACGYSFFPPG